MYKSLEDLMAGIYEMAAPDGIICNEVSKFLAANQVKPEDISSGIWFFLWLKSAPKDAKPIQKEIPGFGVVLNMPTYGGTLNEAITGLIENECRQIELAEGHPSLEAWVESVLAGRDDGEENEAAANIVDLLNGCHDLLDTAIINYLLRWEKSTSKRFCRSSIMESYVTTLLSVRLFQRYISRVKITSTNVTSSPLKKEPVRLLFVTQGLL